MHASHVARAAVLAALAAAGCAHAPAPAAAPATAERRIEVPRQGAVVLSLPPAWKVTVEESKPGGPPTTRLAPPDGAAFLALLTPLWDAARPDAPASPDLAQRFAELGRRKMAETAAETEIALEELVGPAARGYWFEVTDRKLSGVEEVPEGEWRHVMQGAVAVGRVVLTFTLLDDADGPQRAALLDALRGARQEAAPAGGDGKPSARGAVLGDEPLSVAVPGRAWSVLVDLPGYATEEPRPLDGGGVVALAADTRSNAVASVVLRPAKGASDARTCRDEDLGRVRAAIAGVAGLRTWEAGSVARARYVVPEIEGRPVRQLNAHAWRFRDATCVNVHLSLMEFAADDEAALERILETVRFSESM
jgi:hypothetical protein